VLGFLLLGAQDRGAVPAARPEWQRRPARAAGGRFGLGGLVHFLPGGSRTEILAQAEELMDVLGRFFKNHTKDDLLKLATENRFQLGPCNNAEDILKYPQHKARGFWKNIEHPELGTSLKYPGGAVKTTQGYVGIRRRAPRIGEHNEEIYKGEFGLTSEEIIRLKQEGII